MDILISDNSYSCKLLVYYYWFCRTTRKSRQPSKKKVNKNFFPKKEKNLSFHYTHLLLLSPYVNTAEIETKTASVFSLKKNYGTNATSRNSVKCFLYFYSMYILFISSPLLSPFNYIILFLILFLTSQFETKALKLGPYFIVSIIKSYQGVH
jgi:hypothetical protein